MRSSRHEFPIRPSRTALILGAIAAVLALISLGMQLLYYLGGHTNLFGLVPYFNIDNESNIPTLFAVMLLLFAALLLFIIYILDKKRGMHRSWMWGILAAGFLFLAIDEFVCIHEKWIKPMRNILGPEAPAILHYSWVLPGLVIVLVVLVFFLPFWMRLPARTRIHTAAAAVLYIGGAVGMEMVCGSYVKQYGNANLTFNILVTIEESLEYAGVILFIYGLLRYAADTYELITLQLASVGREKDQIS